MSPAPLRWLDVSLKTLASNLSLFPAGTDAFGPLEADAFGLGAARIASFFRDLGVSTITVSALEDAAAARKAGFKGKILHTGAVPGDAGGELARWRVTPLLDDAGVAKRISRGMKKPLPVHVRVALNEDSPGVPCFSLHRFLASLARLKGVRVEGLALASHWEDMAASGEILGRVLERIQNGAPSLVYPLGTGHLFSPLLSAVHPGSSLYGITPAGPGRKLEAVRPVASLHGRVAYLKKIEAGRSIGYGRAYVAEHPTRIATVPVGYADGYPRALSGRASVLLRGRRVPLAGRVCMERVMVDVGEEGPEKTGDDVVLWGRQNGQELPVTELAEILDVQPEEIACSVTARVPRVYRT